ncbi:DNA translocase FtsK [Campylobacter sp. FMV-PI01]|uniref:DNA translocase FtsK n=1 Tax=Campylobacter portucalensis TaxID=2608384 RepID=A0A6L5WLR2_9BACT|nr:DNA translocase FtsK [Campylobacter portucalensis]MSN96743.1 DNA translocase FtsK [Campylobacter portucalensis]
MVGSFGVAIGKFNIFIFGYLAYIYPIISIWLIYFVFKYLKRINFRFFEFCVGFLLLFLALLIAQANIFSNFKGFIGSSIESSLKDIIGSIGIWVFLSVIFVLSFMLIFEEKSINLIKKAFIVKNKNLEINLNQDQINSLNDESFIKESVEIQNLIDDKNLNCSVDNLNLKEDSVCQDLNIKTDKENLDIKNQQDLDIKKDENKIKIDNQKPQKLKNVEHLKEVPENKQLLEQIEQGGAKQVSDFKLPPLEFLKDSPKKVKNIDESEIDQKIYDLLDKLRKFKIDGDVVRTYSGPVVTTFEFRPAAHIKVSKILTLQDDLAMALRAKTIRIQAPIPGKDVVGIEIPNQNIQTIYLKEVLESDIFKNASSSLTIALGKDIVGQPFITDLKKLPHLLIAGTTGSGKSVGINAMLLSLLYRNSPKTLKFIMIDPKMLEFSIYDNIPHLLTPVITNPKKAVIALSNLVGEMERRYTIMAKTRTKNIENFNQKAKELGEEILPYIVVIIDELADLMMTSGKDVEFYIARLAQMARASGIHLIVATQRPSADVLTGLIKTNLPSRISYRVGQKIDSRIILDQMGAESLLGRGDMLFTPPSSPGIIRLHAPFASEDEIIKVVEFLKSQETAVYDEKFLAEENTQLNSDFNEDNLELDPLYEKAKEIVLSDNKTSISYIQRRLNIGYNKAATLVEQLEITGVLSQPNAKGQREILNR